MVPDFAAGGRSRLTQSFHQSERQRNIDSFFRVQHLHTISSGFVDCQVLSLGKCPSLVELAWKGWDLFAASFLESGVSGVHS